MVSTSSTDERTTFTTVLIANRGEIALRVMATCRRLGLRSVAIYTELDRGAPHVREADDAVLVGSYLDIAAVVDAARTTGAGAIHPGYGFLSERAEFARAVEQAGLVLVGPSAEVMDKMGRKDAAREIAVAAGVPVVPSFAVGLDTVAAQPARPASEGDAAQPARPASDSVPQPPDEAVYPVLVKAAAGGGGKGMRIVRTPAEYAAAVVSARREALSAFGDDTILVEKYVEHGRHVEVQVIADAHGNVVHLFERDCSTQRRHQKVLEEAPAPTISEEVRRVATESAVALARAVGYRNAGTVEFLLDSDTGDVYFLEMNTRLQVEHPVTELVVATSPTGEPTDLVQLQLRVAQGEPLPFTQDDVRLRGHAIEARVYAEDPFHGFLPQAGTATLVSWPERARVDAALETGQVVSTSYDPMLGKVIVHAPDRETARRALVSALDDTAVLGLTTNVGFLRALAASDEFRDAAIDTAWLDRHTVEAPASDVARVLAAKAYAEGLAGTDGGGPFAADGWRISGTPAPVLVELGPSSASSASSASGGSGGSTEPGVVRVDAIPGGARIGGLDVHTIDRQPLLATDGVAHRMVATVDGRRHEAVVAIHPHEIEVVHQGHRHVFHRPDVFADQGAVAGDGALLAPMPGTVLTVNVAQGQEVAEGEVLGVMEAMKMELALKAPFDGVVTVVGAAVGDQVALGGRLFLVELPD